MRKEHGRWLAGTLQLVDKTNASERTERHQYCMNGCVRAAINRRHFSEPLLQARLQVFHIPGFSVQRKKQSRSAPERLINHNQLDSDG